MTSKPQLKRYGMRLKPSDGEWYLDEDENGAFVKLTDVEATIERLTAELAETEELREATFKNMEAAEHGWGLVTAERDRLTALLRRWIAGVPAPPEWHWSFQLNIDTVDALNHVPADETTKTLPHCPTCECDPCPHKNLEYNRNPNGMVSSATCKDCGKLL